jgi:hypothetical protein
MLMLASTSAGISWQQMTRKLCSVRTSPTNLMRERGSVTTTRSPQLSAIRMLRAIAVGHYTLLHAQERLVNRALARCMEISITAALSVEPPPPIPPAPVSAPVPAPVHTILPASAPADDVSTLSRTFVSPAEQTTQRYQQVLSHPPGPDSFPIDPITNFCSTYPTGFRGCMFCGSTDHVFRACPQHDAPGASDVFYCPLFAHKPHLRRRPPYTSDTPPAPTAPAATLSFPVNPILPPLPPPWLTPAPPPLP